jgi:hypothetical protein
MKTNSLALAFMATCLLMAALAFAQTAPVRKQPTQEEGGPTSALPCSLPYNANPAGDPNCGSKQHTQNLSPSPGGGETAMKSK